MPGLSGFDSVPLGQHWNPQSERLFLRTCSQSDCSSEPAVRATVLQNPQSERLFLRTCSQSDCSSEPAVRATVPQNLQSERLFLRTRTVLLAPQMDVNTKDGQIEVYFGERQNHININLKIWKEGDEANASVTEITGHKFHHHVGQGGAGTYCLRAEAVLDLSNKRNSTDRCVRVNEPEPSLLIPLTAGIAVTLSLMLALILGLITPRCSLWIRKSVYNKEAMPNALVSKSVFIKEG
ncbi:cytokine receptor family member B16 [Tachysurus ichikawai]